MRIAVSMIVMLGEKVNRKVRAKFEIICSWAL